MSPCTSAVFVLLEQPLNLVQKTSLTVAAFLLVLFFAPSRVATATARGIGIIRSLRKSGHW